jgi:glycosyltransferase involved in cell wall biosynthesis
MDPSLLDRVPKEVQIHRVFSPEFSFEVRQKFWSLVAPGKGSRKKGSTTAIGDPKGNTDNRPPGLLVRFMQGVMRRIYCPDPEVLWGPFALRAARKLVREHGIDTVLITLPPYSSILVGLKLKKEFPALNLVADFRDEWLEYYLNAFPFYRSDYIRRHATRIERETAEQANLIVTVTPAIHKQMRERYSDLPAEKFALVSNGYDSLALAGFKRRPHRLAGRVVVSYAGTMHESSSPRQYFDALDKLPEHLRRRVQTRMIGRVTEDQEHLLHGRRSDIERLGFVPQNKAFELLEESDYLLLIQHHSPSLTGKVYEYLAMGIPILAITATEGELAKVMEQTKAGLWADPDDPEGIAQMLTKAITAPDTGESVASPQWDQIERFDRRNLTREYSQLMRAAAPGEKPTP